MGRASDLSRFAREAAHPKVSGSFDCMVCGEDVEEAEHIIEKKLLRWTCKNGHTSQIEVLW